MANESDRNPASVPEDITELVQIVTRRGERLAIALGLPREAKYTVLSALGTEVVMPELMAPTVAQPAAHAIPQPSSGQPAFILEIARGANHIAQFVRSFLAGQAPPAFQLSPVAFQLMGDSRGETPVGEEVVGTAGPVRISLTEDPARDEVIMTARLQAMDVRAAIVRLSLGHEGAEPPPELVATFNLSADDSEAVHRLSQADVDVLHIEVEPQ